jgi:hypothetical protein
LNPEHWGSTLIQEKYEEGKACDKKKTREGEDEEEETNQTNSYHSRHHHHHHIVFIIINSIYTLASNIQSN